MESGSKRTERKFHAVRIIPQKLNNVEVKQKYQLKNSNRFAALEKF
jgi:hypothetical protein